MSNMHSRSFRNSGKAKSTSRLADNCNYMSLSVHITRDKHSKDHKTLNPFNDIRCWLLRSGFSTVYCVIFDTESKSQTTVGINDTNVWRLMGRHWTAVQDTEKMKKPKKKKRQTTRSRTSASQDKCTTLQTEVRNPVDLPVSQWFPT